MKQLKDTINEVIIEQTFDNIDKQIITETLQCQILKDVAKQLITQKSTQNANIKRDKEEYQKKTNSNWYPGLDKSRHLVFREIFSNPWTTKQVKWSEIDDKCVTVYEPEDVDKKLETLTKKVIDTKIDGIIIIQNPETDVFEYVIFNYGDVVQLKGGTSSAYTYNGTNAGGKMGYRNGRGKWVDIRKGEKIALLKDKRVYFIDLTGKVAEYQQLKVDRQQAQRGMISLDPYEVSKIAKENVERYKKIIAQMKAKQDNADELLNKCKTVIQKISDLAIEVAKDAVANADMVDPVAKLTQYIYDKMTYIPPKTYSQKGYYTGVNGLLPQIVKYTTARKKTAQGQLSDMYRKEMEDAKKSLENILQTITTIAQKYNIDLGID